MSITSVGSSFDQISPRTVARETAASARAEEAKSTSVDAGSNDWPPRTASEKRTAQLEKTALGRLVAAQEEANSKPAVSTRTAASAYARSR
ncbi:MAG: hypothetical protein LWW93_01060 [Hyphomicrobiales bacterium]|nr:hypothetical protein [Hyphomicrobiales bacterium]